MKASQGNAGQPIAGKEARQVAPKPPKRRTLVGESTNCAIQAATNLQLKKKVFKLGNIDDHYNEDDVKAYVES